MLVAHVAGLRVLYQLIFKAMFCYIVLVRKMTPTIAGRKVLRLSFEKCMPQVVFVGM